MQIQINLDTRIAHAQNKFHEVYPYLKIDFYNKPHDEEELSRVSDMISPNELFSSIKTIMRPESIDIGEERTVAQVEQEFYDKFGVAMQVSRKSGDVWLQTSKTDHLTLKKQNESGKAMSEK
ncbi:hypothetical protein KUV50_12705 [Membranicola marinus]|uniref:Uncharacterized protein n=1 Tax=Membranihabitans marinus TaxID=1227546 RepID=A0A953HN22_9BACT|nr:hypothetical protein [Membranihabitans marinus]MBY5959004.1 hypothetical protein [Membranihabitans marinus]